MSPLGVNGQMSKEDTALYEVRCGALYLCPLRCRYIEPEPSRDVRTYDWWSSRSTSCGDPRLHFQTAIALRNSNGTDNMATTRDQNISNSRRFEQNNFQGFNPAT